MKYKLVTFDVTNTLLKLRLPAGQNYAKIAELHGVKADPVKLTASFNSNWKQLNIDHPNYGRHTGLDSSGRWWSLLVHQTFAGCGHRLNPSKVSAITSDLIDIYRTEACWTVRPGVLEVLRQLESRRNLAMSKEMSVGIISNFDEDLETVLNRMELSQYFDFVLASYVANCYKPQSEIFDLALRESCTKCRPHEALHVGDDVHLDYLAARSAGWNSLLVSAKKERDGSIPLVDPAFLVEDIRNVIGFIVGNRNLNRMDVTK